MSKKDVQKSRLRTSEAPPSPDSGIAIQDDVLMLVTQVFCPNGHNLVGVGHHEFDGFPGISIFVSDGEKEGLVELSPIHGDASKVGPTFKKGQRLSLRCPVCKIELPVSARCSCSSGGALRKIYLSPSLDEAHVIHVCDVWGCRRSRIIDSFETISEYIDGEISDID